MTDNYKRKSKNNIKCTISNVGNKLVENCQSNRKCELINNILECPGYDNISGYGTLDDYGLDLTYDIINIESPSPTHQIDSNYEYSNLIRKSLNDRKNKINSSYKIEKFETSQETENKEESINQETANDQENINQENINQENINQENINQENINQEGVNLPEETQSNQQVQQEQDKSVWSKNKIWLILLLVLLCIGLIVLLVFAFRYMYKETELQSLGIESPSSINPTTPDILKYLEN